LDQDGAEDDVDDLEGKEKYWFEKLLKTIY
jgi:hypothetical protein